MILSAKDKKIFRVILFCLIIMECSGALSGQALKGSKWIGGGGLLGTNLDLEDNNLTLGISPLAGFFFNEHWALAAEANFTYTKVSADVHVFNYRLAPIGRYYFGGKKRSRFFVTASPGWEHSSLNLGGDQSITEDVFTYLVGAGLNTWLGTDVALENTLHFAGRSYLGDATSSNYRELLWQASLQAFLPPEQPAPIIPAVGKGAWRLNLEASGGWSNSGADDDYYLSLRPGLGYFIADHLMIGADVQLAIARNNRIIDGEYYARYYPLPNSTRWQPLLELGGGTRFQFLADPPRQFDANLKAGTGLDLFLSQSIAIEALAYYYLGRVEDKASAGPELLELSLGIEFFLKDNPLFKKGKVEKKPAHKKKRRKK